MLKNEEELNFLNWEYICDENGDKVWVAELPETEYVLTLKVPVQE